MSRDDSTVPCSALFVHVSHSDPSVPLPLSYHLPKLAHLYTPTGTRELYRCRTHLVTFLSPKFCALLLYLYNRTTTHQFRHDRAREQHTWFFPPRGNTSSSSSSSPSLIKKKKKELSRQSNRPLAHLHIYIYIYVYYGTLHRGFIYMVERAHDTDLRRRRRVYREGEPKRVRSRRSRARHWRGSTLADF